MASRPPRPIATATFDEGELTGELVVMRQVDFDTSRGLLFDSAKQFTMYAHHHMQKSPADIHKAFANLKMAGEIIDHLIKTEEKDAVA